LGQPVWRGWRAGSELAPRRLQSANCIDHHTTEEHCIEQSEARGVFAAEVDDSG